MKILTVQNRMGIGDMVIFLPFIEAISKKFSTPVSILVKENSKASQFLKNNKYIDKIIILDRDNNKKGSHDGIRGFLKLINKLKPKEIRFHFIIDLNNLGGFKKIRDEFEACSLIKSTG